MNNTFNKPAAHDTEPPLDHIGDTRLSLIQYSLSDFDIDDDPYSFYEGYLDDDKLNYDEVDDLLPIVIEDLPENAPFSFVDQGINWALHARYLLSAWFWFVYVFEQNGAVFTHQLYLTFTAEQKAILQRGYDIANDDYYPPLLGREQYVTALEANPACKSPFDFPVRRIKNDPVQLSVLESKMNSHAPGAFLH